MACHGTASSEVAGNVDRDVRPALLVSTTGEEVMSEKSQESRVRSKARRQGYRVRKSRRRKHVPDHEDHGEYMILDADTGFPVFGFRYDASLDEVEAFLSD